MSVCGWGGGRGFQVPAEADSVCPNRNCLAPTSRALHFVSVGKLGSEAPRLRESYRDQNAVLGTWQACDICLMTQRMDGQIAF